MLYVHSCLYCLGCVYRHLWQWIIHSFPWHEVQPDEIPLDDVMVQMSVYTTQKIQTAANVRHTRLITARCCCYSNMDLYLLTCVVYNSNLLRLPIFMTKLRVTSTWNTWWWHLCAETCRSWHLILSVFYDLFYCILICAFCWLKYGM